MDETGQSVHMIALDQFHAHPANSNVMPAALVNKLADHIARSDRYPPIIVRPHPQHDGDYQILDGHHRVAALRSLERSEARCVIWEVDDDEAMLLLATLNRLQGQDDPHRRADLVSELTARLDVNALAAQLPESADDSNKLLALRDPPAKLKAPQPLNDMPVCVHFFLKPAERKLVERALSHHGPTREAALVTLCRQAARSDHVT